MERYSSGWIACYRIGRSDVVSQSRAARQYIDTVQILYDTAVPLTGQTGSNCGGDYVTGPNNDWGYGTIAALAAVEQALQYGNVGRLQGTVVDAQSLSPLRGADISSIGAMEWITTTNSLGLYSLRVPSGTYTVSASLIGYYTDVITHVTVISGGVTTQDLSLWPVPVTISGTVADANTCEPLAGEVQVSGGLITTTLTDPVTGIYSLILYANRAYTLTVQSPGYGILTYVTDVLKENTRKNYSLLAGWLEVNPTTLDLELIYGKGLSVPITLTNTGGVSLTYELGPTVSWLMVSPTTGTLPASSTLVLGIQIDPTVLPAPGVYTTTLIVETDTPYDPVSLPVNLMIVARHDLYLPMLINPAVVLKLWRWSLGVLGRGGG